MLSFASSLKLIVIVRKGAAARHKAQLLTSEALGELPTVLGLSVLYAFREACWLPSSWFKAVTASSSESTNLTSCDTTDSA